MIPGSPMVVDDDHQCPGNSSNKRNPQLPLAPQPLQQQQQQKNDMSRNVNITTSSSPSKKRKKREDKSTIASTSPSRSNKARRGAATSAEFNAATGTTAPSSSGPVLEYQDFCELPLTLKTVLLDEVERITRRDSASFVHHHAHFCSNSNNSSINNNNNNNNNTMMMQQQQPPPSRPPVRLVHDLPATVTIQQVLKHFCKKQQKANKQQQPNADPASTGTSVTTQPPLHATDKQIQDFCQGLNNLFQEALPTVLLYPQERPQYEALVKRFHNEKSTNPKNNNNKQQQWTEIYGCEYLLRLYVRLPLLMQNPNNIHPGWTTTEHGGGGGGKSSDGKTTTIMADDIRIVGPLLTQLLVLLQKNRQACFKGSSSYREPKPEEWTEQEKRIMMYGDDYHEEWNRHPSQHDATTTTTSTSDTARDHSSMDTV